MKIHPILKASFLMVFILQTMACTAATPAPSFDIGSTQISEKDGMVMVFVPAGEFTMGSDDGPVNELPIHQVTLPDFWIDQTEVTNAMFARFIEETDYQTDGQKGGCSYMVDLDTEKWHCIADAVWDHPHGADSGLDGLDAHPVVQVSWNDARVYCEWAGRRLPTEAEWEKAARSDDARKFPWGNEEVNGNLLNLGDEAYGTAWSMRGINDGYQFTSPVGHYPEGVSPYGAFDMAGNVWEWNSSLSKAYPYDPNDGREDLSAGGLRALRGGAWDDFEFNLRTMIRFRGGPTFRVSYIGFRCADSP
jgi:formylglycine-generating enzyme required for sulfatase activity